MHIALKYMHIAHQSQSAEMSILKNWYNILDTLMVHNCPALTSLPDQIGKLTALTTLTIRNCPALTTLPPEIGDLSALITLNIWDCSALNTIPNQISKCITLRTLRVLNCFALTVLPPQIGQLRCCTYEGALAKLFITNQRAWQYINWQPQYQQQCPHNIQQQIWVTLLSATRFSVLLPEELWCIIFAFIKPWLKTKNY